VKKLKKVLPIGGIGDSLDGKFEASVVNRGIADSLVKKYKGIVTNRPDDTKI
jgi:hypothetical protein